MANVALRSVQGVFYLRMVALLGLAIGAVCAKQSYALADYLDCLVEILFGICAALICVFPKRWTLVSLILPLLLLAYNLQIRDSETESLRAVANMAKQAALANRRQNGTINPSARTVVWDVRSDRLSGIHYSLPRASRGLRADARLTIFLIWDVKSKKIGVYREASAKAGERSPPLLDAFQDTVQVAVVSWPDQTVIGWQSIVGELPPQSLTLRNGQPEGSNHGFYEKKTTDWIRSTQSQKATPTDLDFILACFRPVSAAPAERRWTESEARAEAVRRYPQLSIANSPMNRAFVERYNVMKSGHSAYLERPDWPLRLAEEVAR